MCVGIDYSYSAWNIASDYVPKDVHIYEMAIDEIRNLPFDYKIDIVHCHDVLEHCPINEWEECFKQLKNKLSNNVVFCGSTPSTKSGEYLDMHNNYFDPNKIHDLFNKFFKDVYFCNYNRWYYIIAEDLK